MTKHYNFKSPKGYYSFSGIIIIKCLRFTIYESLNKSILIKQKTIGSQACHCTRLRPAPCLCVRKHIACNTHKLAYHCGQNRRCCAMYYIHCTGFHPHKTAILCNAMPLRYHLFLYPATMCITFVLNRPP